ncbi:MAG: hypothetical protein H0T42_00180 [Deltaproteobacteria bacterium]|nr:hypothetical protein [Deltaproteobacteria bacterium]
MNLSTKDLYDFLDDLELTQGRDAAIAAAKNHARAGREFAKTWLADHAVAKGAVVSIQKAARDPLATLERAFEKHDDKLRAQGFYDSPLEKLEKGLAAYCATNKIDKVWTLGLARFAATDEGAALKRAYDENPAQPSRPAASPVTPTVKRSDAMAALTSGLEAFCTSKGISKMWTEGLAQFRNTPDGRRLADDANGEG